MTPSENTLARFALPSNLPKLSAWVLIAIAVSAIAVADYLTGIHISLLLFYLFPVTLTVAWLGWRSGVVVACICVCLRISADWYGIAFKPLPDWYFWNALTSLFVFMVIIWLLDAFLSLQRALEQRVIDRTTALIESLRARHQLEEELLAVATRERNALGHELHDEICQHLVGTALAAHVLVRQLGEAGSPLVDKATAVVALVEDGADKTRRLAHGLLLTDVEPSTLEQKLNELADDTRELGAADGVACTFTTSGDTAIADAGIATQLLRITQEALRNALRHARAKKINIELTGDESSIVLAVRDNGSGFVRPPSSPAGMGLRVMANRAAFIGASFMVQPNAECGTEVLCRLPRTDAQRTTGTNALKESV